MASNKVTIVDAILFILLQLLIGLIVVIQFDWHVIVSSFLIIPLVVIYPLLKRITYIPQFFLGLAFNWGSNFGHLSQNSQFDINILYLFFAGVFLTTAYDTIYGFQDLVDDKKLGLKSLSILLRSKNIFSCSYIF